MVCGLSFKYHPYGGTNSVPSINYYSSDGVISVLINITISSGVISVTLECYLPSLSRVIGVLSGNYHPSNEVIFVLSPVE